MGQWTYPLAAESIRSPDVTTEIIPSYNFVYIGFIPGAKGMADAGSTYRQILQHFYRGVTVSNPPTLPAYFHDVRVRLTQTEGTTVIRLHGSGTTVHHPLDTVADGAEQRGCDQRRARDHHQHREPDAAPYGAAHTEQGCA